MGLPGQGNPCSTHPTHLLKMLNDDFWVLDVFGDIGDHQCPCDLDREDKWRRKSVLTWYSWVFGWPRTSKTGFPLVTPGRLKYWVKPCRGMWGGVKSIKSTRMDDFKGADPTHFTEPLKG